MFKIGDKVKFRDRKSLLAGSKWLWIAHDDRLNCEDNYNSIEYTVLDIGYVNRHTKKGMLIKLQANGKSRKTYWLSVRRFKLSSTKEEVMTEQSELVVGTEFTLKFRITDTKPSKTLSLMSCEVIGSKYSRSVYLYPKEILTSGDIVYPIKVGSVWEDKNPKVRIRSKVLFVDDQSIFLENCQTLNRYVCNDKKHFLRINREV